MAEQMKQDTAGKAIPAGYKQTEVGVIPETWGCLDLSELFSFKQGIQVPVEKQSKTRLDGFVRFIRIIDLTNQNEPPRYIKNIRKTECLTSNDLFMVRYGAPGLVGFNKEGLIANNLFRLLPKVDLHEGFYFYYLGFRHADILDVSGSSTMPAINFSTISKFKIVKPSSVKEQTAIANVLSDSDALIDALEQLIAKKQAIKSATMQQLLTGRTRLPAFALHPDGTPKGYKPSELGDIPEDWEVDFLGNISDIIRNGSNYKTVSKDGVAVTRIETIADGFIDLNRTGFASIESINGSYKVLRGDILYSHINSIDHIGKVAIFDGGSLLFHGINLVLIRSSSVIDPFWLFNFLSGEVARKWAKQVAKQAVSQASINTKELKSLLLAVPSIQEQTAIATILSDMDNELQALTQKLEKARALKQGMMQQLLTGKIRLPLAAGA